VSTAPRPFSRAMLLAAGLGTRMRPITLSRPKPLVQVAGRTLVDHVLDRLAAGGVETVVVNVHHLAEQMEAHLAGRAQPRILVSDEREALLDSGGGVAKALPMLGPSPFIVANADSFWLEGPRSNVARLVEAFDAARMDILMLLAPTASSAGYDGRGDFGLDGEGRLKRRGERETVPFAYAGVLLIKPRLFDGMPPVFSLNRLFDAAEAEGRLFGLPLDGIWLHVGTPSAIGEAEARMRDVTL
jgi:N-acetyl-alpha-D-muramate 1-phosphate uridylyltransferase